MSARILIIEDNAANMDLMQYLLQAFGHRPIGATQGLLGFETARRELPDLIICDVHLPQLDGFGVLSSLRTDPATRAIPVLAVTAQAMVGDRERLLGAGFDGYMGKPIEPEYFVAQVDAFLPAALRSRLFR